MIYKWKNEEEEGDKDVEKEEPGTVKKRIWLILAKM